MVKKKLKNEIVSEKQRDLRLISALMSKVWYWNGLGPDLVQVYWLKKFCSLHGKLRQQLQDCLKGGIIPNWVTRERIILIMKDKSKANTANSYRPFLCLLLGMLSEGIYEHLNHRNLLPEECKILTSVLTEYTYRFSIAIDP